MKTLRIIPLAFGFAALTAPAHAQLVVQGKNDAALCYEYAAYGNAGSKSAIETCTSGLSEFLSKTDKAATFVNRGILLMRKGDQEAASKDFTMALEIRPDLTEAYVNYGASLIRQKKYGEAQAALNKALEDTESATRPDALYNRAITFDYQENYRGAYNDLKSALILRPDWDKALALLDRYEVRPAG
jgi:Tfp pilus assembly protein PilF